MKIKKVNILNLNSLRLPVAIDFGESPLADTGLFAITGDTGAGKTTILDAITLALYGRIHRNKDVREVLSYGAVECLAEVEFDSKGESYRAKWSLWRSHKKLDGNFQAPTRELALWNVEKQVFEILATKTRDVDQMVEEVTGLDYDRFCRSVLLSQGDFAAFLMATEKERSDLLERITGTEIYSRLSRAAYQRHKLEAERLHDLQKEQQAMQMLSEEELEALQAELDEQHRQALACKAEMDRTRRQLEWLIRIGELEERLEDLTQREAQARQQIEERKTDFERLALARKAAPLREDLRSWQEAGRAQEETQQEIARLATTIEEQRQRLDEVRERLQAERRNLEAQEEHLTRREQVFSKVAEMDVQIREKQAPLAALQNELKELDGRLLDLVEQQSKLAQAQSDLQAAQQKRRHWLEENQRLQSLEKEESLIRHQYEQWREYTVQIETLRLEIEKRELEIERLRKEETDMDEQLAAAQRELAQQQAIFVQKAPDRYALDRGELLRKLYQEIEQLTSEQQSLQAIERLAREYQNLLAEQNALEERLEDLQGEELALGKRLLSAMEVLDEWNERVKYKQAVYEQQQLIANYEKDRHNLQEGEPCPLCFSTEHPFRTQHVEPYVDRARFELERARKEQERIYRFYRSLLERHTELSVEIQHLMGNELKAVKGQLRQRYDKILGFEERLSLILPDMARSELPDIWGQSLRDRLDESMRLLQERRENRDLLAKLDQDLGQKEEKIRQLREQKQETQANLRLAVEKQRSDQDQWKKWSVRAKEVDDRLQELLRSYGFAFHPEQMGKTLQEISALHVQYQTQKETERAQGEEWRLNQERQNQLGRDHARLLKEQSVQEKRLKKEEAEVASLQTRRRELFGEADPEAEKEQLRLQIKKTKENVESVRQEIQRLEQDLAANNRSLAEKQTFNENLLLKWNSLKTKLKKLALQNDFESLEALEKAVLPPEEQEGLAESLRALQEGLLQVRQSKKEKEAELAETLKKEMTDQDLAAVQLHLAEKEQAYAAANQREGALREQLLQNERRQKAAADLLDRIKSQEKNYLRWAKLNDIIGMADGKKFRVFAQGLTLRKLVYLANQHLQRLNGRYLIEKNPAEDLGLNIVDTYQADNRRSMNTLSGGERFLVSLALALGLSDLAGKDTRIESLFIDEGFGALDDNSLDLALDTLENLQAQGKTIGIISHVKALKERIAVQIQVRKKGSGFSEIEVTG